MPPTTRFVEGTVITDGAGAGSASIVTTGYQVRGITVIPLSITGGTITARDNNGAGTNLLPATSVTNATRRAFGGPTNATSPLVIAITGGGATKAFRYEVELERPDVVRTDLYLRYKAGVLGEAHGAALTTIPDVSGNGRHGTKGGVPNLTLDRTSHAFPSFAFTQNATSTVITRTVDASAAWTLIVVARQVAQTALNPRYVSLGAGLLESGPFANGGNDIGWFSFAGGVAGSGINAIPWHIVATVGESNTVARGYVDGVQRVGPLDPSDFAAATTLQVGRGAGTEGLTGFIADVLVYREALPAERVLSISKDLGSEYGVAV